MLRLGGVVIHMQQTIEGIEVLVSGAETFEEIKKLPVLEIFCIDVINFLDELSGEIRKDKESRAYPDLVTFGFFCRKANLIKLKEQYYEEYRMGRGLSFHIAPSNVPINFAYSMVIGLLAGNAVIVRTSTKEFRQINILCRLITRVIEKSFSQIGKYIAIVKYERKQEINDYFSAMSDIRVVWGGDSTIREIRKSEVPVRCVEIAFSDRYSLCILNAKEVCKIEDFSVVARNFYNDTYLYDQNACSSPRLLYWIGNKDDIQRAKEKFWRAIKCYASSKYTIEPVIAVEKLMTDYRTAIEFENVRIEQDGSNLFHRILIEHLSTDIFHYTCPGGSFLEYDSEEMSDLLPLLTNKVQTLSYLGMKPEEIADWLIKYGVTGVDRIVPMGKTTDLTLTWDGYNLIQTMSRKIYWE